MIDDLNKKSYLAIELVEKAAGGRNALAKILKISPTAVSNWKTRNKRIPLQYIYILEEELKIPKEIMRPDVYPGTADKLK